MALAKKVLPAFSSTLKHLIKCYSGKSTSPPAALSGLDFSPKFSPEEQEKILKTLNQSSKDQLKNLKISQTRLQNLEDYKNKNGPFKSLNDLLEVDGLGVKLLEKLCTKIISFDSSTAQSTDVNNCNRRLKNLVQPPVTVKCASAVGIHISTTGISWARLHNAGQSQVECWGYEDFGSLPRNLLPTDTFCLAQTILGRIPPADVYILERPSGIGPPGQQQPASVVSYNHQLEFTAMLLASINTSQTHNPARPENRVYFLKAKLPARLFKTLVGNERVSSNYTIAQLIQNGGGGGTGIFTLPCTPVSFNQKLKNYYLAQSSAHKDLMGQALMLVIAFTDLCVRKSPVSISAISGKGSRVIAADGDASSGNGSS